jgi:hypothetical protein
MLIVVLSSLQLRGTPVKNRLLDLALLNKCLKFKKSNLFEKLLLVALLH